MLRPLTGGSFRLRAKLDTVTVRTADKVTGNHRGVRSRQAGALSKDAVELPPSERAGPGRCCVTVNIDDVQAVVVLGVSRLDAVVESIGDGGVWSGAAGPDRIQPGGGVGRGDRVGSAARVHHGHGV